jgi:ArsR family transcriptional regulator
VTIAKDSVSGFKALGDPTRLRILELLKSKGQSCCDLISRTERGLCACDIEQAIGLSQTATSHHMEVLKAGLVTAQKRGRWMFYAGTRRPSRASPRSCQGRVKNLP